uniref:TGT domain-containing protein n=1 Tax=Rodentolepis nana TaxID=102285 RepID=A0A0R3T461_RODNA
LARFSGLNFPIVLFQNDSTEVAVARAVDRTSVQIWAVGGRLPVTMEQYADCVLSALPVAYQMPVDNETAFPDFTPPTKKRCQKSVQRTKSYSEMIEAFVKSNETLSKIPPLISVTGGNDLDQRLRGVDSTDFTHGSGVVLDGFFLESLDGARATHLENVFTILKSICEKIPPNLPRFMASIWQPDEVVRAVRCGVDIFDGSLPFRLTRSGIAWLYTASRKVDGSAKSWIKFPFPPEELKDEVYKQPLLDDCPCFACKTHNRGYISHLHSVDEMLAHILLMIHNSVQCYAFFDDMRKAIADNRFDEFEATAKAHHFPEDLIQVDLTTKSGQINDA